MAERILMNKNSLAALKTELKEYNTALPVFEMKEQQLKKIVQGIENSIIRLEAAIEATRTEVAKWVAVMADHNTDMQQFVNVNEITTRSREVAGIPIKEFVEIKFEDVAIDMMETPLWLDTAVDVIIDQKTQSVMLQFEYEKLEALKEELAEARRMKNALKEVFIPETQQNIRKIEIYLGDVERLAIGCAKLIKKKKESNRLTHDR